MRGGTILETRFIAVHYRGIVLFSLRVKALCYKYTILYINTIFCFCVKEWCLQSQQFQNPIFKIKHILANLNMHTLLSFHVKEWCLGR